jgi:hypothetical protein
MLNAANRGGAFMCNNCIMTLSDSEVRDNDAFDGGAFYSVNEITLTATRTVFYNNKAKNKGGVLSVTNQAYTVLPPTIISFQDCDNIERNKADYGGFAFYDNEYAELIITDSKVDYHTAYKRAAFIEAINMGKFTISSSFLSDFFAPEFTVMHSTAQKLDMKVENSDLVCENFYKEWEANTFLNDRQSPKSSRKTNIYLESSLKVDLFKNKVKQCGASLNGGVFWLA